MEAQYHQAIDWLEQYPQLYTLISLTLLILAAWLANWVVKRILVRGLVRLLKASPIGHEQSLENARFISRLANIVPDIVMAGTILPRTGMIPALFTVCRSVIRVSCTRSIGGRSTDVIGVHYSVGRARA